MQVEVLRQQLELAKELNKPASVHCVRAYGDLLELMKYAYLFFLLLGFKILLRTMMMKGHIFKLQTALLSKLSFMSEKKGWGRCRIITRTIRSCQNDYICIENKLDNKYKSHIRLNKT